ncbi:Molecular chaperone GrpE (heat shock protein) [Abditibacterium utsteinense]|uniref:Molecular chaperone GrpE (Heat shock protein) n=1 Tax=Abditibacterium utsteinense TaxID=1960156 RepID=A0A2S8SX79_9BACT|nr:nucleotide exchange factor GrpE [Abditibacterium utsteinense]PQV65405.1 Molecular chaperone GrpE (heat shock protein) [Abditibacterium utsteinense]
MADEQEKYQATPRFRLPKFFTQGAEAAAEATLTEISSDAALIPTGQVAVPGHLDFASGETPRSASSLPINSGRTSEISGAEEDLSGQLAAMQQTLSGLSDQITQVNERETSLERVFDALHSELADYKNDFLYEHLKPVVRPLLFLFDSMEQFDGEVSMAEATMTGASNGQVLSPPVVRENVRFFRDQLIEALRTCEVTIMDAPRGAFNAKFHKAVDVMPVPQSEDGHIVRVVRSGWFLNGQLLRPADVVVGKFRG